MEILEKKHLKEATDKMFQDMAQFRSEVLEALDQQKHIQFKLYEAKNSAPREVLKRAEALEFLGGISIYKLREMEKEGKIKPFKLGGTGHDMYRIKDLEKLVNAPYIAPKD